jgi:hypothetical protein
MLLREQCAIVWVCSLADALRRHGPTARVLGRHALMLAGCAAVYVGLRLAISPIFETAAAPWRVVCSVWYWMLIDPRYVLVSVLAILYALGLPLMAWFTFPAVRQTLHAWGWPKYYLLLSVCSIFCGSDKARLVFLAQPVLILLMMHGLPTSAGRSVRWLAAVAILLAHVFVQFPPSAMIVNGRLQGPLIDEMDRGTHGANIVHGPGYFPIALTDVALHLAVSLGLACLLLLILRRSTEVRGSWIPLARKGDGSVESASST